MRVHINGGGGRLIISGKGLRPIICGAVIALRLSISAQDSDVHWMVQNPDRHLGVDPKSRGGLRDTKVLYWEKEEVWAPRDSIQ